jgi:methylenetetrahydrofolate dehydrogenase (NADP+)/methenyltetrahydrofolate cyclohydrolase
MTILDGKSLSIKIKKKIKQDVQKLQKQNITPGLAVVLVGVDSASTAYVKMKSNACKEAGIYSITHEMPESISQENILEIIQMMNKNQNIDGILIQLPLPKHIDRTAMLEAIDSNKDVDGFHPFNVGRLVAGIDGFIPATPYGVMKLLEEYNINPKGQNVCIVGASSIVGKPMATLMLNAGATVDICHAYTKNLKEHTLNADIICVGVGKINLITEDMVKNDVIIVDIGVSRLNNGKLTGDVDFKNVSKKSLYITPSPGGVGPMTIAMLLENTVKAASNRKKRK